MNEEAIEDAWIVSTYLSDSDLLLSSTRGSLIRSFEAENVAQSLAASIVVRGLLFGNSHPVSRYSFKYKCLLGTFIVFLLSTILMADILAI